MNLIAAWLTPWKRSSRKPTKLQRRRRGGHRRRARLGFDWLEDRRMMHGADVDPYTIPVSYYEAPAIVQQPSQQGQWGGVIDMEIVAIHAVLLPTGKVMYWDRSDDRHLRLWDPQTGDITTPALPDYNIFCSGHTLLGDGRLLVTGGHQHQDGVGEPHAAVYDPYLDRWQPLADMSAGRWYPTTITLADGSALTLSGSITPDVINTLPQVWDPRTDTWRDLTGADDPAVFGLETYPKVFLAPDGRVFKLGPGNQSWFLDTAGEGSWTPGPTSAYANRNSAGAAVMYEPGKILVAGGDDPPGATAEVIDLNAPNPQWRSVAPMAFARRQANATVLPDGRVLVTGGTSSPGANTGAGAVLNAEIWDPATERWTTLPEMQVKRVYHSTAVLLPDGRVLSAGGGEPHAVGEADQPNGQAFSPDYLFAGPRPTIDAAPKTVFNGEPFFVHTADAARIAKVSLVRPGSNTHTLDQNQRFVPLDFEPIEGGLQVRVPESANVAPPGHYLLFLVDSQGAASAAEFVQVGQAAGDSASAAQLVIKLYRQVLGREPDPSGLQYWSEQVARGGATLGEIASHIFESNERLDPIIRQMYRDYLHREADEAGLATWRDQVWKRDGGPDNVIAGIVASREFFITSGGANRSWLSEVYRRLLRREADAEGLRYWTDLLDRSRLTREQVVLGFVQSRENFHALVRGWHQQYLGYLPNQADENELAGWMIAGASQREVQILLIDSPEYGLRT